MKKSFLQTFIVLGLFSIFLFGNVAFALVKTGPEPISWTEDGKTISGKKWVMDSGRMLIVYKKNGDDEFTADYWSDEKKTKKIFTEEYNTENEGLVEATTRDKKDINEQLEDLEEQKKNAATEAEKNAIQAKIDALTQRKTETVDQLKQQQAAASEGANDNWFQNGLQTLAMSILIYGSQFVSWLVGFVGYFFDKVIEYTTTYPQSLSDGITNSWRIIRDFSNIILVFSLLYLGIKTIIEGQGFADKKTLVGIIIAAVLINFSLVFVRDVAFNISNTVGLQILEQSGTGTDNASSTPSTQLMSIINPQQVLNMNGFNAGWGASNIAINDRTGWGLIAKMTGQFFMFTTIVLAMGVIFLGASIILLYRFMIFIVLMIASPFGLISTQIPWLQKYGKDWSEQLKKQTIVFPAFMLILYLVLLIVTTLASSNPLTLNATTSATAEIFNFLFNFILIIGFLLGLLILPGKIGAAGADLMTNAAGWTTKKIKSMPRSFAQGTGRMAVKTTQFGAGMGAYGLARSGRYIFGNKVANRLGGKTEDDEKALKQRAQGTGFNAWRARRRLDIAEALKGKTYDMRNIDAVKKSKFGKGMGTGIESYTKAIKTRTDEFNERKNKKMERYGYDKAHETRESKIAISRAEQERDRIGRNVVTKKNEISNLESQARATEQRLRNNPTNADVQAYRDINNQLDTARNELDSIERTYGDAELAVGKAKNIGEVRYMEHDAQKWTERIKDSVHGLKIPFTNLRPTDPVFYLRSGTKEQIQKDYEKKWKEKGQSKDKKRKKKEDEWLENGGTPPPASSSSTPSAPTVTTTVGSSGGTTTT